MNTQPETIANDDLEDEETNFSERCSSAVNAADRELQPKFQTPSPFAEILLLAIAFMLEVLLFYIS